MESHCSVELASFVPTLPLRQKRRAWSPSLVNAIYYDLEVECGGLGAQSNAEPEGFELLGESSCQSPCGQGHDDMMHIMQLYEASQTGPVAALVVTVHRHLTTSMLM